MPNDYIIPVAFPEYKPTLVKGVTIDMPYGGGVINIPKFNPLELGHAGVLLVDGQTGATRYYEYGRYNGDNGQIKLVSNIPDVTINSNGITEDSLKRAIKSISDKAGSGGRVIGTIIEGGANSFNDANLELRNAVNDDAAAAKFMGGEYRLVGNNCYDFPIKIAQKYFGADLAEIDGWAISPASGLESIQNHNGGFIFDPSQKSLTWVQPEQGDWSQNTSDGPWNADYLWDGRAEVMTEFFPSGDEWTYGRVYADECIELRRENGTGLLFDKNGNLLATVTVGPDGVAYRDVKTGVVEEFMSDGTHRVTAPDGQENAELPADIADLISSTTDSVYAAEIGSRLGSTLGHYLGGDNPFAQVAGSAVLGAFGQNIGQVIDRLGDGQDLSKSIDEAFLGDNNGNGAFSKDLLASVKSAAIGAVSSLLVSELADAVGLDKAGMVGDLINVGLNGATSLIGTNAINMLLETNAQVLANMSLFDGFKDFFNLDGFTGSVAPPAGSPPGTVVPTFAGAVGSFLGGMLASEVMPVTSTEGAIGSALGGAVGSYVGQVVIPIPFLGAFVGSFAGSILGGLLGDLFGGGGHRPTVTSTAMVDFDGTEFHIGATGASGGGDVGVAISMASQAVETLNAVLKLAGGAVINPESLSGLRYGQQDVWYVCGNEDINDPQRGLESSIVRILKDVDFEGADPFVVRAIQRTDAQTVQQLMGEIQIAKDYENYLDNREEINAIIAANPESAFAVGWALTLKEARRLELDKPHPDEFLSRLDKAIAAQDIDLDGRTIHDAVMELKDGVLTIAFRDPANDNHKGHTHRVLAVRKPAATFGYTPQWSSRFAVARRSA